jgi:hypothetical protein
MERQPPLAFKWESPAARLRQDLRVGSAKIKKARWFLFELAADADLSDALY